MSRKGVQCIGSSEVRNWFETNADFPYFSVWNGRQILFSYYGEDQDEAINKLMENIEAAAQNGMTDILTLYVHPEKDKNGYITDKTPRIASLNFRCVELNQPQYVAGVSNPEVITNRQLMERLNELESRLTAQEEVEEEAEEEEDNDFFGTILKSPEMKQLLMTAAVGMIQKFSGSGQGNVQSLAGTGDSQDEKINYAIEVLKKHDSELGDDLLKLASIAENDGSQFKFLLQMLRK